MNALNKEQIREKIKQSTLKSEIIHVDEWDSDVLVKELSGSQYVSISNKCLNKKNELDNAKFITFAIIASVYSLENEPLFTDAEFDEVGALNAEIYTVLTTSIMKLNKWQVKSNQKN